MPMETSQPEPSLSPTPRGRARAGLWLLIAALAGGLAAPARANDDAADAARAVREAARATVVDTGDLPAIGKRGTLRVLIPAPHEGESYLPRRGHPLDFELRIVEKFARARGLSPVWVPVPSRRDLIPWLLQGRGDLIAAGLAVTPERKQRIAFSVPITTVREQVVVRADAALSGPEDLAGRSVAVRSSSVARGALEDLQKRIPDLSLELLAEDTPLPALLDGVEDGRWDAAVANSHVVESVTSYRSGLRAAFDLGGEHAIAWGVRPDSTRLLDAANRFLGRERLVDARRPVYKADLPGIEKRNVLRVLTRNNATSYFLWRGELLGFEYELVRRFAEQHGLLLEMIVPPSRRDLVPWLLSGRGDLIAASMTISDRKKGYGVAFSRPYKKISEVVVARAGEQGLHGAQDLEGRSVVVRRSSAYWETLRKLRDGGLHFALEAAPETMEDEEIIARVASGEFDLTVTSSEALDVELTWRDDVKAAFPLGEPVGQGWAVREGDEKLLAAVNAFIEKEYRSTFYNITYDKYFHNPHRIMEEVSLREPRGESSALTPYDDLVRKFAAKYGFDWHLIAAQMYQESRFDPQAKSWTGARGLMQILPRTAAQFGFKNLLEPATGIEAGVRYLAWLRDRFESELSVQARTWFALAAYNAGLGHVRDARRLARRLDLDPNRWFGNVERAMRLLSQRKYARRAHYGYVRGSEPVRYVRAVRDRYRAYVRLREARARPWSRSLALAAEDGHHGAQQERGTARREKGSETGRGLARLDAD